MGSIIKVEALLDEDLTEFMRIFAAERARRKAKNPPIRHPVFSEAACYEKVEDAIEVLQEALEEAKRELFREQKRGGDPERAVRFAMKSFSWGLANATVQLEAAHARVEDFRKVHGYKKEETELAVPHGN